MTAAYIVLDSVALADPRVKPRDVLKALMWAKHQYAAKVFVVANRRSFELSSQAELEALVSGVPRAEHFASDMLATGFRPLRDRAYDERAWVIAFVANRLLDYDRGDWPTRAWKYASRGRAPMVLIRNGCLTPDEERQVAEVNRGDRRPFELVDPRNTDVADALARIVGGTAQQ